MALETNKTIFSFLYSLHLKAGGFLLILIVQLRMFFLDPFSYTFFLSFLLFSLLCQQPCNKVLSLKCPAVSLSIILFLPTGYWAISRTLFGLVVAYITSDLNWFIQNSTWLSIFGHLVCRSLQYVRSNLPISWLYLSKEFACRWYFSVRLPFIWSFFNFFSMLLSKVNCVPLSDKIDSEVPMVDL